MDLSLSHSVVPLFDSVRHHLVSVSMICLSLLGVKRLPAQTPLASDEGTTASISAIAATISPSPTATPSLTPTPSPTAIPVQQSATDLLSSRDWSSLPGATREGTALVVNHTSRSIVEQDGSAGVENPAIALAGPHVSHSGDVRLSLQIQSSSAISRIFVYARPPRIYDEFIFFEPAMVLELDASTLRLRSYDGRSNKAILASFPLEKSTSSAMTIDITSQAVTTSVNGKTIGSVPTRNLLSSGKLWLGIDTPTSGGQLRVTQLSVTPLNGGTATIVNTLDSLKKSIAVANAWQTLTSKKSSTLKIGAAVALGPLVSDPRYYELATEGWYGVWTTENALKAQFVHPSPTTYAFGEADAIVELARRAGISVHGHTLVFGEANPAWMQQTEPAKREAMMLSHIKALVSHFKGKIKTWDVINEPLDENYWDGNLKLRNHIWHQAMGASYIEKALRAAKESDPQALLFINEWGLEEDSDRFTGMLSLLEDLLKKNVPVDGLGFQAHVYERGDEISQATLQKQMERVVALGKKYNKTLYVRVSELDAYGHNSSRQADQYSQTLSACMKVPNCISFSMWGIAEKYSSTSGLGRNQQLEIGDGLPFGENFEPLSAVSKLQETLQR